MIFVQMLAKSMLTDSGSSLMLSFVRVRYSIRLSCTLCYLSWRITTAYLDPVETRSTRDSGHIAPTPAGLATYQMSPSRTPTLSLRFSPCVLSGSAKHRRLRRSHAMILRGISVRKNYRLESDRGETVTPASSRAVVDSAAHLIVWRLPCGQMV